MCNYITLLFFLLFFNSVAFSQNAKSAEQLYEDGIKLSDESKYKEAITLLKAAIEKKPGYTDALYETGWCYNELEAYDSAIVYLEKAKETAAPPAKIYFELAYAYDKTGNTKEAVSNYAKTLETDPQYYDAARNLGDIYYADAKYEEAADYYKTYIDNSEEPGNNYYYKLGWCLNDLGKYEEAVTYLEKYDPDDAEDKAKKMAELGYAHYKSGEYELSVLDYSTALDLQPAYGTAIRGMADSYYAKEDYSNALKYYKQAIDEDEENSKSCYYRIGWIYNDKENFTEAITALQKAIEYDAKDAANREELGYAYYMSDKYDDAVAALNKAIELNENSKLGYYYKGLCYVALNDKEKAKEVYEKLKIINEEQAEKLLKKINGE